MELDDSPLRVVLDGTFAADDASGTGLVWDSVLEVEVDVDKSGLAKFVAAIELR